MRLPWSKPPEPEPNPHRPHRYRSNTDGGIAALAPVGGGVGRQVADLAATSAYTRTLGCSVPGCGKAPDDLIHAPED